MISGIFTILIYQPLLNITVFLYNLIPGQDLGVVIIVLTILIKLLLYPISMKGFKSQKSLAELEPKIKEIREKFKNDQGKATREIMALYQKAGINPFSGSLLLLLQIPILFGLFRVFSGGILDGNFDLLYSFLGVPNQVKPFFLGVNLAKPYIVLALLAVLFQFVQTRQSLPKKQEQTSPKKKKTNQNLPDFSEMMRKQMLYFFPIFTFLVLVKIPSAISLYLLVSSIFSILQTARIN